MTRLTVSMPEELAGVVIREARRKGVSVSMIVREAVSSRIASIRPGRLPFVALGRSGKRHTARDAEKILARDWNRARDS